MLTQNGVDTDTEGGLNLKQPIHVVVTGVNNDGSVKEPLMNIDIYHYDGLLQCAWEKIPLRNNKLHNIDACTLIKDNCHFSHNNTRKSITACINLKELAGPLLHFVAGGDYNALQVTVFDGMKPIECFWVQDQVKKIQNNLLIP